MTTSLLVKSLESWKTRIYSHFKGLLVVSRFPSDVALLHPLDNIALFLHLLI